MRSERLSSFIRARKITGREVVSTDSCVIERSSGAPKSIKELSLNEDISFDIATLSPLEFKKFTNLDAFPHVFRDVPDVLRWALALLSDSPVALGLIKFTQEFDWEISVQNLDNDGYHLDLERNVLEIDNYGLDVSALGKSSHYRKSFLVNLMKGLRDIWHHTRHEDLYETFKPESILLLERARAADVDAVSILIGWELRSQGHNGLWRHILSGSEGDMAQVLINIMDRYPTALYTGMALAHVFRQWYADTGRIDGCDHTTLEDIDFMMNEMADAVGDHQATAPVFEDIAQLPDGSFYLNELGETVARDPFFCGINDPINQAHLFQIVYDSKVTFVQGIPFRDRKLARKFFGD